MRASLLLVIAGARAAPELVVEVEVNGKMQELRASPEDDPRRAAHAFCVEHNLTVSVENMACGEMLAEELVEKGARYPLPSEKLLRVRGGVVPPGPWRDRAQQLVPPHCPGEVLLPLVDGAIATPRIAVDVSTEFGNVPFFAFDQRLVNATAYPSKAVDGVGEPLGRAASAFCSAWFCKKRSETAHQLAVKLRRELLGDHSAERPQRLVVSLSTLPGRIAFLKDQLRFLHAQTRKPDAIYVVVRDSAWTLPFKLTLSMRRRRCGRARVHACRAGPIHVAARQRRLYHTGVAVRRGRRRPRRDIADPGRLGPCDQTYSYVVRRDGPAHGHYYRRRRPRLSSDFNRAPVSSRSAEARRGHRYEGLLVTAYEYQ